MGVVIRIFAMAAVIALLAPLHPGYSATRTPFERVAEQIRLSYEQDFTLPDNLKLYAHRFPYSHNYDDPHVVSAESFVRQVRNEKLAIAGVVKNWELRRFVVGGDTVAAFIRGTGEIDSSPVRLDVGFLFTITDGRISAVQSWYDREQLKPVVAYLSEHASSPRPQ